MFWGKILVEFFKQIKERKSIKLGLSVNYYKNNDINYNVIYR
jgi:hypothetical protein